MKWGGSRGLQKLVKNLLCRYGFGSSWQNQGMENDERFLLLFKSRLRDNLIQEWVSDINISSKAIHYRNFYGSFGNAILCRNKSTTTFNKDLSITEMLC